MQLFLNAIQTYCEPYFALQLGGGGPFSLASPIIRLVPMGVKRKFSLCDGLDSMRLPARKRKYDQCGSMAATGASARKLAYQPPRLLRSNRWPSVCPKRVQSMPVPRANAGLNIRRWPSGPPQVRSMPGPRYTPRVSSTRRPPGPPRVQVPRYTPRVCAQESNVRMRRFPSPYEVSVYVPYQVVLRVM